MGDVHEASPPPVSHRWIGIVGLFVAPTTVITSVCFYFGYASTRKYFAYFGIDSEAIGFTSSEYALRSVSVLYGPVLILLLMWVLVLWGGAYLRHLAKTDQRTRLIRRLGWTAATLGGLCVLIAVGGIVLPRVTRIGSPLIIAVTLGLGIVALVVGYWLLTTLRTRATTPRPFAAAERASLFVAGAIFVMALFWITDIFANAYGENQAEITAGKLWTRETVIILDTTERLDPLDKKQIVESRLGSAAPSDDGRQLAVSDATAATYRYMCFRQLVVRGDLWVLVPARWTPQRGYAVIISDDSSNRISIMKLKGIADTGAVDWDGDWQCPEVAPPTA